SEALAARGVLCKETQDTTLRVAPPLVITRDEIDLGVTALAEVLGATG
ncbi:ornithine--oxo-acid transaminase, partial [Kibdelosporangium lantanae]